MNNNKQVHGAKRKSSKGGALSKQFMLNSAKCIAEMIIDEKVKNDGRVPWGFAAKLLNEGRKTFPNLSRRTINNYVIKLQKERKIGRSVTVDSLSNDISSLTTPNGGAETSMIILKIPATLIPLILMIVILIPILVMMRMYIKT